jgi:2-methylfumaryl-CoA hydratase
MRPATGYFFEDYAVGQKFVHAIPRTITHGDTTLYQALTGSRNPVHCSEPFAQLLGYRTTPVDDLLVFHIAFGKTVPDISYNAVANLGYAECRFVQPVYVGDTLHATSDVIGLKANSNGTTGIVYVRSNCFNQHDELVLTWVRWVMVHRRKALAPDAIAAASGQRDFQSMPERNVVGTNLTFLASNHDVSLATGGRQFWDDYVVDDGVSLKTITHPAGITIDETDHTLATKLYQNTARVHFDLHHMAGSRFGRRLIYGGQLISLARALSFDGLENALSIAAINGGSHLNPTFAGDTVYATSTPLASWPVNEYIGALQIELAAYKNIDPSSTVFASAPADSKVLSMDLTLLLPRRR